MVNNMEIKESLRQYLTYNKDFDSINNIFISLYDQMKYLHKNGFYVSELSSDTIFWEESQEQLGMEEPRFTFVSISRSNDKDADFSKNVLDLTKLAVGAFISTENGFCDYTKMSTEYIKRYLRDISYYLPNSDYFENVLQNGDTSTYYSDYIRKGQGAGKTNAIVKTKTTEYGKMYASYDEAAFIRIVFYPVIIISLITVVAVLSKILN